MVRASHALGNVPNMVADHTPEKEKKGGGGRKIGDEGKP